MVTIQHLIKEYLESNPLICDLLQDNLINISSLSEKLIDKFEKTLNQKIKLTRISMAFRREIGKINKKSLTDYIPKNIEINTKNNLCEISIEKNDYTSKLFYKDLIKDVLFITQGNYEINFLLNNSQKNKILNYLSKEKIENVTQDVTTLSINFQKETKKIIGIYHRITKILTLNNISILFFNTIGSEFILGIEEKDFLKTYSLLEKILKI